MTTSYQHDSSNDDDDTVKEDLKDFMSNEETLLSKKKVSLLQTQRGTLDFCAELIFSLDEKCGYANGGQKVYLKNKINDKRVKATVEKANALTGVRVSSKVYELSAGEKMYIDCSVAFASSTIYNFYIVGCEVN
jgi:hypothetical protein